MKWTPTPGRKPRTDKFLHVQFRNGVIARGLWTANQQGARWSHSGDDWDIVAVAVAKEQPL